jgi:hypothetical protein
MVETRLPLETLLMVEEAVALGATSLVALEVQAVAVVVFPLLAVLELLDREILEETETAQHHLILVVAVVVKALLVKRLQAPMLQTVVMVLLMIFKLVQINIMLVVVVLELNTVMAPLILLWQQKDWAV